MTVGPSMTGSRNGRGDRETCSSQPGLDSQPDRSQPRTPAMTPRDHCGTDAPDQAFCVWCGAHRTEGALRPQSRHHHYAAQPGEHVVQPSPITTLFPHLPGHRVHEFRWALIGGLAVIVLLVATGLIV